jgi:hypothetical protein
MERRRYEAARLARPIVCPQHVLALRDNVVVRVESLLRNEPDADESMDGGDEQGAARIASEIRSQIIEVHRMFGS